MKMKTTAIALFAMTALAGGTAFAQGMERPANAEVEKAAQAAPKDVAAKPIVTTIPAEINVPENIWVLDLSSGGRVEILLRPDIAPVHVDRIKTLTRQGFYDGLIFHRVVEGFMAQSGDPTGTGTGDSPLPDLQAEFNDLPHLRGTVSMARTADNLNSANSQFFIMFQPKMAALDHKYTAFGRVISGMNFVDAIHLGEPPAEPSCIVRASIKADNVPPPTSFTCPGAAPAAQPVAVITD